MSKYYEVVLGLGSKTYTEQGEFKSLESCKAFFEKVSYAEILKIKEIVYKKDNPKKPIDDKTFYQGTHKVIINNQDTNLSQQRYIKFIKESISHDVLLQEIKNCMAINGKSVTSILTTSISQ